VIHHEPIQLIVGDDLEYLCRGGPTVTIRPGGGVVCVLQLRPGNEVHTNGDPKDEEDGKDHELEQRYQHHLLQIHQHVPRLGQDLDGHLEGLAKEDHHTQHQPPQHPQRVGGGRVPEEEGEEEGESHLY